MSTGLPAQFAHQLPSFRNAHIGAPPVDLADAPTPSATAKSAHRVEYGWRVQPL